MVLVGTFPFETEEEAAAEPYYTAPDVIDSCYTVHEVCGGMSLMRKTRDQREVAGMRLEVVVTEVPVELGLTIL